MKYLFLLIIQQSDIGILYGEHLSNVSEDPVSIINTEYYIIATSTEKLGHVLLSIKYTWGSWKRGDVKLALPSIRKRNNSCLADWIRNGDQSIRNTENQETTLYGGYT